MKNRLTGIVLALGIIVCLLGVTACSESSSPSKAPAGSTGSAGSAAFIPSSSASGFVSSSASSGFATVEPAIVRKTIGKMGKESTTKKVTLVNLTGQNIVSFSIKHSLEQQFGAKMLEAGDVFAMDESRDVYYDMGPALDAQAAQTPEEKSKNLYLTYNVQIVLADGSTITLHDFPFNELEKGRILFQNWTGFLEYENPLTGEDIITRQHEADANAADQAAAYAAQQEQWAQQQQWAAQQQQQQHYVAPAQNNDAGCVGDPSLVW